MAWLKRGLLLLMLLLPLLSTASSSSTLYPGEMLITVDGYPNLVKFNKGESKQPLVVFVPGDSHLARIAYGYPGGNSKDFLSYWLHKEGYSFLAVSYPLQNPVYAEVYPGFTIQDWGRQVASICQKVIQQNHLSNHVILVAWSMGGSMVQAFNVSAQKLGLQVDLFVGLSAVPPLPYIMQSGPYSADVELPNGLADRSAIVPVFSKLLALQNQLNGHVIIPEAIYQQQFLGDIPVDLVAAGPRYEQEHFVQDISGTLADAGTFNFSGYPWISLIVDTSSTAAKIILVDPASWNMLRAEMIYHNYLAGKDLTALASADWQSLTNFMNELPSTLTLTVPGSHFFFVGEQGARATAEDIQVLALRVKESQQQLAQLTQGI